MSNLTCKALAAAAVSLLEERPLDKITVRDITDRCGLTRNTFYYHFQDIYDLLGYIFREEADATLEKYSVKGDWKGVFLDILSYLKKKKKNDRARVLFFPSGRTGILYPAGRGGLCAAVYRDRNGGTGSK